MTYRTLRSWLDRLQATDRLAVARPGVSLDFTLAALAKRWDARKAVLFPEPLGLDGSRHEIPVVSGLRLGPGLDCRGDGRGTRRSARLLSHCGGAAAPVARSSRGRVPGTYRPQPRPHDGAPDPEAQCARRRGLYLRGARHRAQPEDGYPERLDQPPPDHGAETHGHPDPAPRPAPFLRRRRGGRRTAGGGRRGRRRSADPACQPGDPAYRS